MSARGFQYYQRGTYTLHTSLMASARNRSELAYGMTLHLERIRPHEDCHQWYGKNGNYGAHDPCFKVQAPEPILLRRTRVENEEPKTEFWEGEFTLVRRSLRVPYLQDGSPWERTDGGLMRHSLQGFCNNNSHFESPSYRKAQIQGHDGTSVSGCPEFVGSRNDLGDE